MFVGETGIQRIVERTAQLMKQHGVDHPDDVRKLGVIDLPTVQRALNLWFTLSLDLFGGEVSSNAASSFANGLKGRAHEDQFDDHMALGATYGLDTFRGGAVVSEQVPMRNAMNEVLRDGYIADCQRGVDKWNKTIAAQGVDFTLTLPSRRFHRHIGAWAEASADPTGALLSREQWQAQRDAWLPSERDRAYIASLMREPVYEPTKMANWIAPPKQGIKGRPVDFEYVRHDG